MGVIYRSMNNTRDIGLLNPLHVTKVFLTLCVPFSDLYNPCTAELVYALHGLNPLWSITCTFSYQSSIVVLSIHLILMMTVVGWIN
jgi:hypothetical protein